MRRCHYCDEDLDTQGPISMWSRSMNNPKRACFRKWCRILLWIETVARPTMKSWRKSLGYRL